MKSKVIKLYDYKSEQFPEELLKWRVSEEELDIQLALLSRNHARLTERETAGKYDAVRCRIANATGAWERPVTLGYPGRGLCAELENACLGVKVGEKRTAMVNGAELTFTAERVAGMEPMEIGRELIQAEKITGVETVEDYRRWWKEMEGSKRRYMQGLRCADWLLRQLAEKSEFDLDSQEMEESFRAEAKAQREALAAGGVPEELQESEASIIARMQQHPEIFFLPKILHRYIVELLREEPLKDVIEKAIVSFAELNHFDPDQVRAGFQSQPAYQEQIMTHAAMGLLRETYIDSILEVQ